MRDLPLTFLIATALIAGNCLLGCPSLATASESAARSASPSAPGSMKPVIELFTSQGCSSCPAADALMHSYARRKDVIALTLNVDYWDYLGWKDTLAQSKFSDRQRGYAKARGDGMVYTPQVVVNGLRHANGNRASEIDEAIASTAESAARYRVPVRLRLEGRKLIVDAGLGAGVADEPPATKGAAHGAGQGAVREATIWLAVVQKSVEVKIPRGENSGRTIVYANVVRELIPIGTWTGKPITIAIDRAAAMPKDSDSCAVLVQEGRSGPIIGAAVDEGW